MCSRNQSLSPLPNEPRQSIIRSVWDWLNFKMEINETEDQGFQVLYKIIKHAHSFWVFTILDI